MLAISGKAAVLRGCVIRASVLATAWLTACGQSDEKSGTNKDLAAAPSASSPVPSVSEGTDPEPEGAGPDATSDDDIASPDDEPTSDDDTADDDAPAPEPAAPGPGNPEPSSAEPEAPTPEPADDDAADDDAADDDVPSEPAPSEPVPVVSSMGCSADASPPDGPLSIDVDGLERTYIVSLPDDYDPSTPYPLVFAFHGLGGSAELVMNAFYFGIEQTGGKPTIFVYPDGLDNGDGAGWPNEDGRDVAFFDALLAEMQSSYCVDSERVFSTGHSYGGMMTHTLACQRANVLRGIAPVAGAFFGFGGGDCQGPVAAWGAHGNPDNTVDYESGLSAIQRVMETNGCDPESGTPVEPTEFCTLYECDAGYPVTWCVHGEDHNWPDFAAESIKQFFDSF